MKTPEQIAEAAARKVMSDNDLMHEFVGDSAGIDSLAWDLVDASGGLTVEHALVELVQTALEIDRSQRFISEDDWVEMHKDHEGEYDEPRNVIVQWHDQTETPTQAIFRLNDEAMEYAQKWADAMCALKDARAEITKLRQGINEMLEVAENLIS